MAQQANNRHMKQLFCIRCGGPANGSVALECTRCGHTHYLNSKVSASTLIIDADRYLVVLRAREPESGKWDLPGGFCDYGEAPEETARREAQEECGYEVEVHHLLGAWPDQYLEPDGSFWPTINLIYQARIAKQSAEPTRFDPNEIGAVRWVPLAHPPKDMAFPNQQLGALEAARKRQQF
jgi:8-oxo-dGTP diphosphatase